MQAEKLIRELPKGLIRWYDFRKGKRALLIKDGTGSHEVFWEVLSECGLEVSSITCTQLVEQMEQEQQTVKENDKSTDIFDYIIMIGGLERSKDPVRILRSFHCCLNPGGRLLLGTDNRLGIRYFCGDRDPFTERNFDGIENYVRVGKTEWERMSGRSYARAEIVGMLEAAGFKYHRFYSVLPGLDRPQALYAEDYLPEEELDVRIFPQYRSPETVFLEEERLYTTLIENGMFHAMANGYFIECPLDGEFSNVKQVTVSMDRGEEEALATIIRRDDKVEKRALYPKGQGKLKKLMENTLDLEQHGVRMVEAKLEKDSFVMPYVKGEAATDYFRRLLCEDKKLFFHELDRFWDLIRHSSDPVAYEDVDWEHFAPGWEKGRADDPGRSKWKRIALGERENENTGEREREGEREGKGEEEGERQRSKRLGKHERLGVILKRGYIDLVSLNCFYVDGEFVFYDQEFYMDQLPANAILMRTIDFIYWGNAQMELQLPRKELQERYHLNEYEELWHRFSYCFIEKLRNEKELSGYHQLCRRDWGIVNANRNRMNYSENEYERLFRDIFKGACGRQLYLFGSGIYAAKFLEQFGSDYEVAGILDNNPDKWGTSLSGIPIFSPEHLRTLPKDSFKVMICIKNCVPIMQQLKEELEVTNFSVYDWHQEYPRKMPEFSTEAKFVAAVEKKGQAPKKYQVGYVAGVFDLFHVGHLNMFRRAKEQCEYLIVGVVSDESVMKNKKTMPCIPFDERIDLVRSCRYVDEAVALPTDNGDTDEAYRRYHFDVQFSGSDYADDPVWLAKKEYLKKRGADLVFFPYTETTSSTKIKGIIDKKL